MLFCFAFLVKYFQRFNSPVKYVVPFAQFAFWFSLTLPKQRKKKNELRPNNNTSLAQWKNLFQFAFWCLHFDLNIKKEEERTHQSEAPFGSSKHISTCDVRLRVYEHEEKADTN